MFIHFHLMTNMFSNLFVISFMLRAVCFVDLSICDFLLVGRPGLAAVEQMCECATVYGCSRVHRQNVPILFLGACCIHVAMLVQHKEALIYISMRFDRNYLF